MAARYGNRWTTQWVDSNIFRLAQAEWTEKLSKYPTTEVKAIIEIWQDTYPPTLPDLLQRLKRPSAAHQHYRSLDKPAGSRERGKRGLAEAYMALADPAPPRSDTEAYMAWTNKHRRMVRMPVAKEMKPDGSLKYVGDE